MLLGRTLVAGLLLVALSPPAALGAVDTFTTKAKVSLVNRQPNGPVEVVDVLDGGKRAIGTGGAGLQFIDLADPDNPVVDTDTLPTGGTYTASVAGVPGTEYALAAVQRDSTIPTDWLLVVDPAQKAIIRRIDIPKGPDSIGVSPDGKWGGVAIEREFHPDGSILSLDLRNADPQRWTATQVKVPLADENLEPEYIDVNARHQAVVSLQENNAYAIVDLPTKEVVNLFSAGRRTGGFADLTENDAVEFDDPADFQRQPDAVEWLADGRHFISADEGETEGGHAWSIWSIDGELISSVDGYELHHAVRGLYPDDRSDNLGIEPEGAETAVIDGREYALLTGERNATVAAYDITDPRTPELVGVTTVGTRPEVVVHIPGTTRFITGDEDTGVSIVAGVARAELDPDRPQIVSDAPWANISGLGAQPGGRLLMTTRYGPSAIHELRPVGARRGELPGRKVASTAIEPLLDVAADPVRGGYWATSASRALVRLNPDGTIAREFQSINGYASGTGVAVAPDGSAVYLATASRTVLKVDPRSGAMLERVIFDGPAWLASNSDRNRMFAHDLDIAPGGRLAILLSAVDRPALQAGVMALPLSAIDAAADNANVTSQLREVLRVGLPLTSARGVSALAVEADGTVWTANDADKGGPSDVRRYPRAAALPAPNEPDGTALPSGTPVLDATLDWADDAGRAQGLLTAGATSYFSSGDVATIAGTRGPIARLRGESAGVAATGPAFTRAAGAYELNAAVSDSAGRLIVGGFFDAPGGNLVRLLPTGTVDPSFTLATNGRVRALARDGDSLYVAGPFTQIGGVARTGLAKVDLVTGTVDPAFVVPVTFPTSNTDLSLSVDPAAGRLYLVGGITNVGGVSRSGRMAAVDTTTGALLPFAPTGAGNENIGVVVDGDLVITGLFTGVRRYEPDGTLTPGWAPPSITGAEATDLAVTADAVYVGGSFQTIAEPSGNNVRGLVMKLDRATGAGDFAFSATAGLAVGGVSRLTVADGVVYVAGTRLTRTDFGTSEYVRPTGGLVVLDAASGRHIPAVGGANGTARVLLPWGDGIAFVGDATTRFGDATVSELTAFDTLTGRVDRSFRPALRGAAQPIRAGIVAADERSLYVATSGQGAIDGRQAPSLVKIDRATGAVDPAFEPIITGIPGAGAIVGDKLYLGGTITSVDGRLRSGLAAIDTRTGQVDLGFNPKVSGSVSALAVADGIVYIAGDLRQDGGLTSGLKAFDATTGAALDVVPTLNPAQVNGLAYDPRTKVMAAVGNFTNRLVTWDTVTRAVLPSPRLTGFSSVKATPMGFVVYGGSGRIVGEAASENRGVVVFDPRTGEHRPHFRPAVSDVAAVGARGGRLLMIGRVPSDTQLFHYLVFEPGAPANVVAPRVVGAAREGATLTCEVGRWDGAPETFAIEWRRGDVPVGTGATYVVGEGDVGASLTCAVTGTNGKGTATVVSAAVTPTAAGPRNTALPVVTRADGRVSATTGTWEREPTGFTYAWLRDGVVIDGATGATLDVGVADEGRVLTVRVTATNANGSTDAVSAGVRVPAPPVNVSAPTITGLTASPGEWRNAPAFAFEWLRGGVVVGTGATFVPALADRGQLVSVRVVATNADGTATATSAEVRVPAPPLATNAPVVSGTPLVGRTLTAAVGTWVPAGSTFALQWLRDGEPIAGATTASYLVATGDADTVISVRVRASNADGETEAVSAPVRIAIVPVNVSAPVVSGSATLTATPGVWTGAPVAYEYQWWRGSAPIANATGSTYTPVDADEGATITVRVLARTLAGASEPVASNAIAVPLPAAPVATKRPVIHGAAIVGETLTCEPGTFTGKGVVVFTRWVRGGDQVPGALSSTYVVTAEDVGRTLACRSLASNKGGTVTSDSSEVRPEQAKPGAGTKGVDGASGIDGADGLDGADGANGSAGPAGPVGGKGERGAAGRDAKVTCKVSGPKSRQKVTCRVSLTGRTATLTRDGRVYARGSAKSLRATRTITRGTYTLRAGKTKLTVTIG